jgi:hypothetical protein
MRTASLLLGVALGALVLPAAARSESVQRLAVVAGASRGGVGRATLKYAAGDAEEVARVLGQLGGIEPADLRLLVEPDADAVRRVLAEVQQRAAAARAAGREVELFVYYSGHSDETGLLLGESALPYEELRRALDAVPAEVRVLVLDSCASGAITRAKGARRPAFEREAGRVRGHVYLTSSAADEASQESDRLRASFFTHALLAGLRGAADTSGDGVVTVDEAYQFAFRETLARTEATRSGPQHATYDMALVGSGAVVVTDLRRAGAVLMLPEGLSGKIFVRSAAGHLVAELKKDAGARIELAVEPGEYRVRVARRGGLQEAVVSPASGQRLALDARRLAPLDVEATVARGESLEGDGEEAPMAEPAPRAGVPRDRNVVLLRMGRVHLPPAHVRTESGASRRLGVDDGLLLEVGYQRWLTDRVSIGASTFVRGLHFLTNPNTQELDPVNYGLVGVALGAKYSVPLFPGRGFFLGAGLDAVLYRGVMKQTSSGGAHDMIWVPGARARLSLDVFVSPRVLLGLDVGYSQMGRFRNAVEARRDQSGLEAAMMFGLCWGR